MENKKTNSIKEIKYKTDIPDGIDNRAKELQNKLKKFGAKAIVTNPNDSVTFIKTKTIK